MPRVLVVEDQAPLRLLYRVNLEAEGFEVVEAPDGLRGLAAARETAPDIILLDLWLRDLDGWQVAEQLRDDPGTRDIPLVFVTATSRSRDRLRGHGLGAVDYIALPVNPLELAPRIRGLLARSRDELDALRREKIAELDRCVQHEETSRVRFRELIEQHAAEVFGSPVTDASANREAQFFHLRLEDGSAWQIHIEATNPPIP